VGVVLEMLGGLDELRDVQPQGFQKTGRDGTVGPQGVDLQRAVVHQVEAAAEIEFVALGVAAESS
jgi:hypothetical protein